MDEGKDKKEKERERKKKGLNRTVFFFQSERFFDQSG